MVRSLGKMFSASVDIVDGWYGRHQMFFSSSLWIDFLVTHCLYGQRGNDCTVRSWADDDLSPKKCVLLCVAGTSEAWPSFFWSSPFQRLLILVKKRYSEDCVEGAVVEPLYIYIYIYIGGVRGVMVIGVRNGHENPSSNRTRWCLKFALY